MHETRSVVGHSNSETHNPVTMVGMARRALEPGESGETTLTPLRLDPDTGRWKSVKPTPKLWKSVPMWRARTTFRDWNGAKDEISIRIVGNRRALEVRQDAERQTQQRLAERLDSGTLTSNSTFLTVGQAWLDTLADEPLSERTKREYRAVWDRHVVQASSGPASLTLAQVNRAPYLRRWLGEVASAHGSGTARMLRSVTSRVLQHAVDSQAADTNAVRALSRFRPEGESHQRRHPEAQPREVSRAFTLAERDDVVNKAYARASRAALRFEDVQGCTVRGGPYAAERSALKARAVADLTATLAGTGVRIGEALALRWEHVDWQAGTLAVHGTKTQGSRRTLHPPTWLMDRLRERQGMHGCEGLILHSPAGECETPWGNASRAMSDLLRETGYSWATPHTFRKAAATILHKQGMPLSEVADQLGHANPAMTAKAYLGRDLEHGPVDASKYL